MSDKVADASHEAYFDWWEEDNHHVVHGTRGGIAALRAKLAPPPPDLTREMAEALEELIGSATSFADDRVDYEERQIPKAALAETRALLARYKEQG